MDEKSTEVREMKEEKNRKVMERKKEVKLLLLCLTSVLQPVSLGRPYQEYKNSSDHMCIRSYPGQ